MMLKCVFSSTSTESKNKVKQDHTSAAYSTAIEDYVKPSLNFPEEADFNWVPKSIQIKNNVLYNVVGEFTAKNAFGVKSRLQFQCTLRYLGGDDLESSSWELISLQCDE